MIATRKKEEWMQMLEHIGRGCKSDFAALAAPASHYNKLKWDAVIGSRSERISKMKLKAGIGLGGMALRHGIRYQANPSENPSMLAECPVMLAEKLVSGIAFPVISTADSVSGILLLGRREDLPFASQEILFVESLISNAVEIINGEAL